MLRRHVSEWIDSRRRVREEFDFHFEQLADQYLRAGFPVSEARKAAKRRMGSMFRHKRKALYELKARWRDLFSAEMLDGVGPWSRISLIIVGGFLLGLIFSTRVTILTAGVFWLPVFAAGLAWLAVRAAIEKKYAQHYWFGFCRLLSAAAACFAVWSVSVALWQRIPWPRIGASVAALSVLIVANILFLRGLAFTSYTDWRGRCRRCCAKLRLPSRNSSYSNLLVEIDTTSVICPFGHGTYICSHWEECWIPTEDFWHELQSSTSC
jgi:hypothetical protein